MAVAAYTSDLTDIFTDGTTTGWSALGGGASGLAQETDYYIQGTSCLSKAAWAGTLKGMIFASAAVTVPTDGAVFIWITHQTANSLSSIAAGGLQCLIGSSTSAYKQYYIGGSDTIRYDDRWLCIPINPTITADATTGTPTATVSNFGGQANMVGGPTKGAPFAIDAIRYGRGKFTYTAGDLANGYANFFSGSVYNDDINRTYGQLQLSGKTYKIQGLHEFGSTATAVDFRDSNKNIEILNTLKVTSGFNAFTVNNAASNITLSNISISSLGTVSRGSFTVVDNASVSLDSCTFVDMDSFRFRSNSHITGSTFRRCGVIYQSGSTFDGTLFTRSTANSTISGSNPTLVTNATFESDGTNHAYEIDTAGEYSWTDNEVINYATANGTTGNEVIYNVSQGAVIINVSGGSGTVSYRNLGTSTTTINSTVAVTLTGLKELTEVRVLAQGTNTELAGIEVATDGSVGNRSFTFSLTAATAVDIVIHSLAYVHLRISNYIVPASAASLPVAQQFDRNYLNPTP